MCIAILCPKGTQITEQQFRNSWENNFNGAGFMYNDDQGKLHVVKEMSNCDKLYKKYVAMNKKYPDATFVLHFRISNRGVISLENCHPFKVNNKLGFVHNGTITEMPKDDVYSDTNLFNRLMLRKLPDIDIDYLENYAVKKMVENFIEYSKLIFLDNNGKATIMNESKGTWEEDGIWYSNDSHKRSSNKVDMGGKLVSKAELNRLQGGGQNKIGYDYGNDYCGSRHPYQSSLIGGSFDLHDSRTVGDVKMDSKVNSRLGKSYPATGGMNYAISDGGVLCSCCGAKTVEGEVLSEDNECMECVSQEEAADIAQAVVNDGGTLRFLSEKLTVSDDSDDEVYDDDDDDFVECDGCLETHHSSNLINVKEWNTDMCPKCVAKAIEKEYIDFDDLNLDFQDDADIQNAEDVLTILYGEGNASIEASLWDNAIND